MVVGSAALDLPVVRFKGRPDRAAALRAVGEPLRGLAAGLHAAGRVAPPCGGSLKSEEGAFRAAQLAAATANLPDLAQGLPLPLSAGVVNICPRGRSFRSDAEIARYVDGLLASSWWKRRYRHVDRVRVLRGAERRSTVHEERAGQLDMKVKPSGAVTWTLAVQPDYRCELVVLQSSWSWRFDEELSRHSKRLSDRAIVSECRRAGDRTVTVQALSALRRADGARSPEPPPDVEGRRVARRTLVVLGSAEEALADLGLSGKACGLEDADLAWEAQYRH